MSTQLNTFSTVFVLSILLTFLPEIHGLNSSLTTPPVFKTIRLAGSYEPTQGVVEVFVDGEWGAICDDNLITSTLGNAFADVVCREMLQELNITITHATDSSSPRHSYFREGYDVYADRLHRERSSYYSQYFYDNLDCKGTEAYLKDCSYSGKFDICISGRNVAAVKCNDVTTTGDGTAGGKIANIVWFFIFALILIAACVVTRRRRMQGQRQQQQQQQHRELAAITTKTEEKYTYTEIAIPPSTATSHPPPPAGLYPVQPQANPNQPADPSGAQYPPQPIRQPSPQAWAPPPESAPYPPPEGASYPHLGGASNVPDQPNSEIQPAFDPAYTPTMPTEGYQPANYATDTSAPSPPSYESVS